MVNVVMTPYHFVPSFIHKVDNIVYYTTMSYAFYFVEYLYNLKTCFMCMDWGVGVHAAFLQKGLFTPNIVLCISTLIICNLLELKISNDGVHFANCWISPTVTFWSNFSFIQICSRELRFAEKRTRSSSI